MQGIGRALSRLPAARALIAGAAILAGAVTVPGFARESSGDVALAIPRVSPNGATGVALPQPLAPSDAQRIRRIFAAQARADIPAAVADTDALADPLLLGHILADRYLGGPGRATPDDLGLWLARYPGLPDAPAIHAAMAMSLPAGAIVPPAPAAVPAFPVTPYGDDVEPPDRLLSRNPVLDRSVHDAARAGNADRAVRLIARTPGLDQDYGAVLRAEVAQTLFIQGRDAEALSVAEAAHTRARGNVGLAPYIGGLAAWRLDRPETARLLFEAAFRAGLASPGRRAAAAFWAARANLRLGRSGGYMPWMQRAAQQPRTFYGLLARRALGHEIVTAASVGEAVLGQADVDAVGATSAGHRAFALLQVGQPVRAAAELRALWFRMRERPGFGRSILLSAQAGGLKELTEHLAPLVQPAGARLPTTQLRPAGGFLTDPALVYALARLESNFDAGAVSPAGARGLMQLMPSTVGFILGGTATRPARTPSLHDPATNLALGQRYLVHLAQLEVVGADLIRLLAAYNCGPGSFSRWEGGVRHNGDPLLFIESVPNDETRAYIPRALAYSWLYAAQLRLPSASLDELAAGTWPRFQVRAPMREALGRLH